MRKLLSFCLLAMSLSFITGQGNVQNISTPFKDGKSSLETQYNFLMEQSRTYVNNKVVKIEWIRQFYQNASDSIANFRSSNIKFEKDFKAERESAKIALEQLADKKEEIELLKTEKDGIELFGSPTTKSSYKTIMWSIVIIISVLLLFFVYKFKSSNSTTKEANQRLSAIEEELDNTKKKFRIKEQELMRKLQDEINKHL